VQILPGANIYPYILYIFAPPSLAPCDIPPIRGHKKGPQKQAFLKQY